MTREKWRATKCMNRRGFSDDYRRRIILRESLTEAENSEGFLGKPRHSLCKDQRRKTLTDGSSYL